MKIAFRIYSDVLQGRRETIEALMKSRAGVAFAIKMFVIVMLVAGLGSWFGIPVAIQQPLLSERIQQLGDTVQDISNQAIDTIDEYMSAVSQENLPDTLTRIINDLIAQGVKAGVKSLQRSLIEAGVPPEQLDQIMAQIIPAEGPISAQAAQLLAAPLHERWFTSRFGLRPEQIAWVNEQINATAEQVNETIDQMQAEAETLEPPLGARTSRLIRLFGRWLSMPFTSVSRWLFIALVALLVAKLLGGRATLAQHLAAVALAVGPAVLFFVAFIPIMRYVWPLPYSMAIHYFGRVLALIALGWSGLVLLKTLAVAHDFSFWRSAGTLALTWLVLWAIIPAASLAALAYVWWG
jgi:hypothetical protein